MKCLPREKVGIANGYVLHDWHAEVLALRAFNRFLMDECADLGRRGFGEKGEWVGWREKRGTNGGEETESQDQPFALQEDVSIHMYCSEAPCGDASMELTMAEQEDATPWPSFTSSAISSTVNKPGSGEAVVMLGRGHFDQLGIVRRKTCPPGCAGDMEQELLGQIGIKAVYGTAFGSCEFAGVAGQRIPRQHRAAGGAVYSLRMREGVWSRWEDGCSSFRGCTEEMAKQRVCLQTVRSQDDWKGI